MQQAIGACFVKGGVLDVLADDPGALLVPAAKEIAAIVAMRRRVALTFMIMPLRHGNSHSRLRRSSQKACRPANGHSLELQFQIVPRILAAESAVEFMAKREIGNITIVATLAGNGSNGRGGWARMPWGWKNAVRPSRPRFARHLRMRYVS